MLRRLEIEWNGRGCSVLTGNGRAIPVTSGMSRDLAPVPGWRPTHAVLCSSVAEPAIPDADKGDRARVEEAVAASEALGWYDAIICLEWVSESGDHSTWFLDHGMSFLGNSFSALQPLAKIIIQTAIIATVGKAWDQLLCRRQPLMFEEIGALEALCRQTLEAVLLESDILVSAISSASVNVNEDWADRYLHDRLAAPWREMKLEYIVGMLDSSFEFDTTLRSDMGLAMRSGVFTWKSLFDGRPLATSHSIYLDFGVIAYRVVDDPYAAVYYVVTVWAHKAFVYVPAARVIFSKDNKIARLRDHFLERLFIRQIILFYRKIVSYLDGPTMGFSLALRLNHIGHHIWNELTELERLARDDVYRGASDAILLHGLKGEPLGNIERLLPAWSGRVVRDLYLNSEVSDYCYSGGRCLIEPTTSFVSRALAKSIIDVNLADDAAKPDAEILSSYRARGCKIVLIGLRVENRTDVDLAGFCTAVIEAALEISPRTVFVIDCLNADIRDQRLLDAQSDVARRVSAQIGDKAEAIIDLTGAHISRSLLWSCHATFFVSIWGAGLAKYRWLANARGLVVSSRWNLRHRGDLHIYDSPEYMEDPSPLDYIDAGDVEDLPEAPLLVTYALHDVRSISNFHVDRPRLKRAVKQAYSRVAHRD